MPSQPEERFCVHLQAHVHQQGDTHHASHLAIKLAPDLTSAQVDDIRSSIATLKGVVGIDSHEGAPFVEADLHYHNLPRAGMLAVESEWLALQTRLHQLGAQIAHGMTTDPTQKPFLAKMAGQ